MSRITPTDADFDDMHHALGRPDGPHVTPYRNRYVVGMDSPTASRFAGLGLWRLGGKMNQGQDGIFYVTDEGIALTLRWVAVQQRARGQRCYRVSGRDLTDRVVVAKSRSAAVFDVYREISDVYHFTDGFRGFLRLKPRAVPA